MTIVIGGSFLDGRSVVFAGEGAAIVAAVCVRITPCAAEGVGATDAGDG
jgi:hypothetical protein